MYWKFNKLIFISIRNPLKTMNKLKGVFNPLKCYFKYSFEEFDYYPVLWCSKPSYIHIVSSDVMWKDKYDTPRFENCPYIWIHLYKLNLILYWSIPYYEDEYWEQALWYLYYYNTLSYGMLNKPNIKLAIKSWPYKDFETEQSTWNNKYLV